MTDLSSLGYPQGYHLGVSAVLWWIFIIVISVLGFGLYLNARKSDLINVKEVLRAKSFFYISAGFHFLMTQVGVFFPDNFLQFYFSGFFPLGFSTIFYMHYWEKNLTSLKRIPTISVGISTIVAGIGLTASISSPALPNFLWDFLIFTILLLLCVAAILYIYLIYTFSRNVKGGEITIVGWIWMGGIILLQISLFLENPPGVRIFPPFIVFYISPIILTMAQSMAYYGIVRLFTQISSYYANTQKCAVHRGTIEKGTPIHYCPSCGIVYCEMCFNNVIEKDGCWNCRKRFGPESEKMELDELKLELEEVDRPKKSLKIEK